MTFDPNKYLEKKLADFNPDSYLSSKKPVSEEPSDFRDFLVSAGQGGLLGFGDEALAAVEAGGDVLTGGTHLENLLNKYRELQKKHESEYKALQERSPVLSTIGELGGGLAMPMGILGKAKQGAGLLARLGQAAKSGALVGGVASAGVSENTLGQPLELAADIGKGAAGGAAIGTVLGGVGEAVGAGGRYIKDYVKESPKLQRALTAFDLERKGINLTTEKGGQEIINRTEKLASSATDEVLAPLEKAKAIYNSEIDKVKDFPITPETNILEIGGKEFDPSKSYNLLKEQILDNEEVFKRVYPNIFNKFENNEPLTVSDLLNLRGHLIKNSESFNDIRKFPSDASEKIFGRGEDPGIIGSINDALDKYIPNGQVLRSEIKKVATIPEQLINKNIDPTAQPIKLYDKDDETAKKILNSIFKHKIETAGGTSRAGLQARKTITDLGNTMGKNVESSNPEELVQKLLQAAKEEAALTSSIGIRQTGDTSAEKMLGAFGPIGALQTSGTQVAGKTGRILNKIDPLLTPASNVIKYPAKTVDETSRKMAQSLKTSDSEVLRKLGETLDTALQNQSSPTIGAAINSIMQSASARRALGIELGKGLDKQNLNSEENR